MKINFFSFEWFPLLTAVILHDRISWSIRLRWLAISGFFLATLLARNVFHLPAPYLSIWLTLGFLALINVVYYVVLKLFKEFTFVSELIVLHIHIFIDLFFLTLIVHYSGGIENPIYLFYVFHVVISSILFPGLIPLVFATLVVILFSSLIYLEYNGYIQHYCVFNTGIHENPIAIYTILLVFIVTVYVSAYICMTFMQVYRNIKREVDIQNKQLIDNDRKKTQIYRYTSHELKSPIISIKTTLDTILKSFAMQLDKRATNLMQRASIRAGQMLDILQELLELSRDHRGRDERTLEHFDIQDIIQEALHEERQLLEEKNIELNVDFKAELHELKGNRDALKKAIGNLVNNAVRYTNENGMIKIVTTGDKYHLQVEIEDTGIGIPQEDLAKVFDEFYRSVNARKVVTFGTGLGLSLVKKIIEEFGGTVAVKSEENKGTIFTLRIPLQ